MRRPLAKVAHQALLAVGFGAQLQELLLAHKIEGQGARYDEGQILRGFRCDISRIVVKNEGMANLVQTGELTVHGRIDASVAVVEEVDIAFEQTIVRVGVSVD